MPLIDTYNEYLNTLMRKLGASPGTLNEDGEARLSVNYEGMDLDVSVLVFEEEQMATLSVPVCRLATEGEELSSILSAMLAANLFGVLTKGLSLSWSPKESVAYIGYSILPQGHNYVLFESVMTRLISTGFEWKTKLAQIARSLS